MMHKPGNHTDLFALYLICFCLCLAGCHRQSKVFLRSEEKLSIDVGAPLTMGFESVGEVINVVPKGKKYIYTVQMTQEIDLRTNAEIGLSYPLLGDLPNLKILNRGTNFRISVYDTINIQTGKERKPHAPTTPATILRTIADSIDAQLK